jgi:hypothetical protein
MDEVFGRSSVRGVVVEMLQQDSPGSVGSMSHPHAGSHDAGHEHEHSESGLMARLRHLLRPHSHEAADQVDAAMEASAEGMRVLWISLAVLGVTALLQAAVTVLSGSVALLGDTLHNASCSPVTAYDDCWLPMEVRGHRGARSLTWTLARP